MRNFLVLATLAALVWFGYQRHASTPPRPAPVPLRRTPIAADATPARAPAASPFACDGRVHCSQMRSCDEATWFLQHCPGTKMDGDSDGIPCESQWCG